MEPSLRYSCDELQKHEYFNDYEPMKAPPPVKTRKTRVRSNSMPKKKKEQSQSHPSDQSEQWFTSSLTNENSK